MNVYSTVSDSLENVDDYLDTGGRKMEWAAANMPILSFLREQFIREKPFQGECIGVALHVEAKTAVLLELLVEGGAKVAVTSCNPLSTHDDVSFVLDSNPMISSYAKKGITDEEYYKGIEAVISHEPTLTLDDGGDLIFALHKNHKEKIKNVIGGCEETTTGVHRLKSMEIEGELKYPVFAVNDTPMKRLFDNIHGTGESAILSIAITTNFSWAGKTVVVAGYGYCGRGVAKKLSGQNARVIITEVDSLRALEAYMEGYEVMPMIQAAHRGDVFITTTGNCDILNRNHFELMRDGVILANAGHFNVEINIKELEKFATSERMVKDGIQEYQLGDGRRINVLASGRLVNLATPLSLGHPIEIMDQSFGMQAVCMRELVVNPTYVPGVHSVPIELDTQVAEIKLRSEGIEIDYLSETQESYLKGWEFGT
jgi:adenosylhomocysteinase